MANLHKKKSINFEIFVEVGHHFEFFRFGPNFKKTYQNTLIPFSFFFFSFVLFFIHFEEGGKGEGGSPYLCPTRPRPRTPTLLAFDPAEATLRPSFLCSLQHSSTTFAVLRNGNEDSTVSSSSAFALYLYCSRFSPTKSTSGNSSSSPLSLRS